MYFDLLAEKTRYCKETMKGVSHMCRIMEEAFEEERMRGRYQNAIRMIKKGKFLYEDIAECSNLPLKTVKELAKKYEGKPA